MYAGINAGIYTKLLSAFSASKINNYKFCYFLSSLCKTVVRLDAVVYFSPLPFPISKSWNALQTIFLLQILKSELQVLLWFLLFLQLYTTFWTDSLWTGAKIQLFKDHVTWVYSAVMWIKNGTNWKWLNVLKVGIEDTK